MGIKYPSVTYGECEEKIAASGIDAIREELVLTSDCDDIIDEALNLLGYAEIPLTRLREHADEVKESMRPYVNELLLWKF